MTTFNIKDFINQITINGKLLAIDPGTKNIGIAASNEKQSLVVDAFTYKVNSLNQGVALIDEQCTKKKYCGIIVGIPFTHVRQNHWIESIMKFANSIEANLNIPVYLKDESYSTQDAKFLMQNFTKKRQKKHKDRIAACCILEETLHIISLHRESFDYE